MEKNTMQNEDIIQIPISLNRKAFKSGSISEVLLGTFILIFLVYFVINIFQTNGILIGTLMLSIVFFLFFLFWIYYEINKMRPMTITISNDSVSISSWFGKDRYIDFNPDVTVDVLMDDNYRSNSFGPLAGYEIYSGRWSYLSISVNKGWSIDDIRRTWDALYSIIVNKGLTKDDGLKKYLEYRSQHGLDS